MVIMKKVIYLKGKFEENSVNSSQAKFVQHLSDVQVIYTESFVQIVKHVKNFLVNL